MNKPAQDVTFRLPSRLVDRLDAYAKDRTGSHTTFTRADALCELLDRSLGQGRLKASPLKDVFHELSGPVAQLLSSRSLCVLCALPRPLPNDPVWQLDQYDRKAFGGKCGCVHRLLSKVAISERVVGGSKCLLWTGAIVRGYGMFSAKRAAIKAPKASWMLFEEKVLPRGKPHMLHKCKNTPLCMNPAHVEPGTHPENMAQKRRDGTATTQRRE